MPEYRNELSKQSLSAASPDNGSGGGFFKLQTKYIHMKYTVITISLLSAISLSSCQNSVPMVPPTTRTVVGPEGSVRSSKSWSGITEQEGNAVLGPLSNMRR